MATNFHLGQLIGDIIGQAGAGVPSARPNVNDANAGLQYADWTKPAPKPIYGPFPSELKKPKKSKAWIANDKRRAQKRAAARKRAGAGNAPSGASGGGSASYSGSGGVDAGNPSAPTLPWDTNSAVESVIRSQIAPYLSQRRLLGGQLNATLGQSRANTTELQRQLASLAASQGLLGQRDAETQRAAVAGLGAIVPNVAAGMAASAGSNPNVSAVGNALFGEAVAPESAQQYATLAGEGVGQQLLRKSQQDFFNRAQAQAGLVQQQFGQSQHAAANEARRRIMDQIALAQGQRGELRRRFGQEDYALTTEGLQQNRQYGLDKATLALQKRQANREYALAQKQAHIDEIKASTGGGLSDSQYKAINTVLWGDIKDIKTRKKIKDKKTGNTKYQTVTTTKGGVGKAETYQEALSRLLTLGVPQEMAQAMAAQAGYSTGADIGNLAGQGAAIIGNTFTGI